MKYCPDCAETVHDDEDRVCRRCGYKFLNGAKGGLAQKGVDTTGRALLFGAMLTILVIAIGVSLGNNP